MGIMFLFYNQVEDYLSSARLMQQSHLCAQVAALLHGCHSTDLVVLWLLSACQLYSCLAYTEPGTWVCLTNELMGWYRLNKLVGQEFCHLYAR